MSTPLYRKNIRQWEQRSRVAAGVGLLVAAVLVSSTLGRVLFAANGAFMVVTGFVGWCPACATFGRRLQTATAATGASTSSTPTSSGGDRVRH